MAWNCTLFTNFKKRLNSTLQPTGGAVYPCVIKNNTDFKNPTFEILAEDLSDVNYMEFNGDYFYVTNLVSHRTGVWDVTGRRDPMATYKNDIAATRSLLLYNQDSTFDASVTYRHPDERIPLARVPAVQLVTDSISGSFRVSPYVGSFILSAVGAAGGVITYLISQGDMAALINTLGYDTAQRLAQNFNIQGTGQTVEAVLADIRNGLAEVMANELAFGNYAQCIKACYWIPFDNFSGGAPQRVFLGDYNTGIDGLVYSAKNMNVHLSLQIPWSYSDSRRLNYQVQLYLPFCGTVVLPIDKINGADYVVIDVALDIVGGNIAYYVSAAGTCFGVYGANVAAPYAIGSSNLTMQSAMTGALQAVGGGIQAAAGVAATVASGGAAAIGGVGMAAGGISSVASGIMQAVTPQIQCSGSMGGVAGAGLVTNVRLELQYFDQIDHDNFQAAFGHPIMQVGVPVAGYNMCRGFSVSCAGTPAEISEINTYFNSGAYLE